MNRKSKGFALLELIMTIVLVAILGAMVVPYFLSGVMSSSLPFTEMPPPLNLQTVMANIVADYTSNSIYLHDLALLNSNIVNNNGKYNIPNTYILTKNRNYKFDVNDLETALMVTLKDNNTKQAVTYIFTKQL